MEREKINFKTVSYPAGENAPGRATLNRFLHKKLGLEKTGIFNRKPYNIRRLCLIYARGTGKYALNQALEFGRGGIEADGLEKSNNLYILNYYQAFTSFLPVRGHTQAAA